MKKIGFFILFMVQISLNSFGQVETYRAVDGTSVDLEIINSNPDEGRNACIYIGRYGLEGSNMIGANYYRPNKFFINGMAGTSGGNIDLSLLFINKTRQVVSKQTVKSNYRTKYVVKIPIPSKLSFGPHLGVSFTDYSKFLFNNAFGVDAEYRSYSTMGIAGGVSLLGAKHIHLKRHGDVAEAQGTVIHRINADGIFYFNRKLPSDYNGTETIDDLSRKIGYRIYYDAKATIWGGAGRLSMNYMIGVGLNSQLKGFPIFAGLGLGYNFL